MMSMMQMIATIIGVLGNILDKSSFVLSNKLFVFIPVYQY
jgi:hypothetical protein